MYLSELSKYRESDRLEAKDARGGVPKSVWESISAFANTNGGVVVLGARELRDGSLEVVGLEDADRMLDDFWNTAHNPGKLSPCTLSDGDARIESVGGKDVIVIEVPRADRRQRPVHINGSLFSGTYRRDHKGDYRCAEGEVRAMVRDSSDESVDSLVHENLTVGDLSAETVRSYRMSYELHHEGHAWTELPDEDFLCRIGAAKRGSDGSAHPTSAGLLMFGEEWVISSEFPHYFLDYRQELRPDERWQSRITSQDDSWPGNVFGFFRRAYNNMKQALKVPFRLDENSLRVDETEAHDALREAMANCLVNADYNERRGVVFLWKEEGFYLSNPGGFRIPIEEAYVGGNSDPRNERMMKMFSLVNVGERAGGGIPDMVSKWERTGYERPILSERVNPERSTIFLPLDAGRAERDHSASGDDATGTLFKELPENERAAMEIAFKEGRITTRMVVDGIGISRKSAAALLKRLVGKGYLRWNGKSVHDPSQYYLVAGDMVEKNGANSQ